MSSWWSPTCVCLCVFVYMCVWWSKSTSNLWNHPYFYYARNYGQIQFDSCLIYEHTFVLLLATKANISSCPGALMLKMVPSILLKSPHNSALTPRSASMGKTAEEKKNSSKKHAHFFSINTRLQQIINKMIYSTFSIPDIMSCKNALPRPVGKLVLVWKEC